MQFTIIQTTSENFALGSDLGWKWAKAVRLGDDDLLDTLGLAFRTLLALRRYEVAGSVEAEDVEDAYRLSQNDFGEFETGWASPARRSTSVGDVIRNDETGEAVVVLPSGTAPLRTPASAS